MTPRAFVDAYLAAAVANERASGVPWQVTLAQAALESGWGRHAPGNNFFGIKADASWAGARQTLRTREVIDGASVSVEADFRAYATPLESFADHAAFLRRWPRYAAAFTTRDPREFARLVAAAGYATDPHYAATLVKLIDQVEALAPGAASPPPARLETAKTATTPAIAMRPRPGLLARLAALFGVR